MSDKSPLYISALELLAHATELYATDHPRKLKFVILHLANAVELILKDRLIDNGVSIYEPKSSLTINIWSAFEKLEKVGVTIPERPVIELLIDDRNTIQHRFGFPDAGAVFYYFDQVKNFFKRFMLEHYGVELDEALKPYLTNELLTFIGLSPDKYAHIKKLAEISPEAAIQEAYNTILVELDTLSPPQIENEVDISRFVRLHTTLKQRGYFQSVGISDFVHVRSVRNRAIAHTVVTENEQTNWQETLKTAIGILKEINRAKEDGIFVVNGKDNPVEE